MGLSSSRLPQVSVSANGTSVGGVLDVEISSNSYLGADRYRLVFALEETGYEVWSGNDTELAVSIGLSGDSETLIVGPVDRISLDIGAGLVHVDGRDLTARFIEARTQETFENLTSSEIATLLASRQGFDFNVVPTATLIGRDFGGDHARTTFDQYSGMTTEWDLLARLADLEQFDVWMDGRTLNFAPTTLGEAVLSLRPQDCVSLRLDRHLSLCADLRVIVRSWDCRGQRTVSQTAGPTTEGASGRSYVLIRPNLSDEAAAGLASRTLAQMAQNARLITVDLPGDVITRPRQTLVLADTNTDFDGSYVITSVERRLSFTHGFTQTLQARTPPWTAFSTI